MKNEYIESVAMSGLFKYLDDKHFDQAWHELNIAPHNFNDQQIIYGQGE